MNRHSKPAAYTAPMQQALDPLAVAKRPRQQRAKQRFERILQGAETLIREQGLSGFSIPALAERLGYTRGSVYAYFPTPYAVLNELVFQYLAQIEALFQADTAKLRSVGWREGIARVVDHAVAFHNSHPVARLLILGGPATDASYRAQEYTNTRLGDLGRRLLSPGRELPEPPPDITTLSVDIGTACFRRSFVEHGEITPAYRDAAVTAMTAFLASYVR